MKKSIVYLALALVTITSSAVASDNLIGPKPTTTIHGYGTPLCLAISKGDVEVVKKFIEYGASVNETSNGMTPLMMAARYNNVEIMKLLVQKGADVKAKDDKGYNAMKFAEISGAKEAVAYLQSLTKK